MNREQELVEEFHRKLGVPIGDYANPELTNIGLRISLIKEEFQELMDALDAKDIVEVIDALCDLKYVSDGSAVTWGICLEPFFNEVHRSNMEKLNGPRRPDGKILKPKGWSPPRIADILDEIKHPPGRPY